LAGAFGLGWFVRWAGWKPLDPTNVSWLLNGEDWGTHLLGWLFFRNEPWALPLGRLTSYVYPVGTTVAFTDSTPWVATLLKPLSPLLPEAFQYIGPWLALCCVLMGVTGALAVRAFTSNGWLQALGGALFVTSPLLIWRVGHPSLCAQWLLVAAIALSLAPAGEGRQARRFVWIALALSLLAAGIHPYLAAMTALLSLALFCRLSLIDRLAPPVAALGAAGVLAAGVAGVLALFGLLGWGETLSAHGFGFYNSDLLALINPRGQSRWLPDLPASRPHYEGWGFLGAGALALIAFGAVSLLVRKRERAALPWRRALPLVIVAALAALFSCAREINVGGNTLIRLDVLYGPLAPVGEVLRGTGRFIWIAHYTLLAAAVLVAVRLWGSAVAGVALVAALGLQVADFSWTGVRVFSLPRLDAGLRSPAWQTLGAEYRHLALVPPQIAYMRGNCEGEIPGHVRVPFAYLAYQQRMTINAGYLARYDGAAVRRACDDLLANVRSGQLDPNTVYLPGPLTLRALRSARANVTCGRLDGWPVCVSNERTTSLLSDLRLNPP
ncbi:MAG TPA: DUF6311 domain-containing protein, partial [Myxococcaceae bacterium]|nr:DUF6311 domain-containing protein [Myxococcaceae bacterium]